MAVYGVFWGGSSYAVGSVHNDNDVEVFAGIAEVVATLAGRVAGRDRAYPTVDGLAAFHVWMADPRAAANDGQAVEYPDRTVTVGPRGGIRVQRV